jgi:lysylphosphatidylglycerol synthetase-like protein (DUF2156 family)
MFEHESTNVAVHKDHIHLVEAVLQEAIVHVRHLAKNRKRCHVGSYRILLLIAILIPWRRRTGRRSPLTRWRILTISLLGRWVVVVALRRAPVALTGIAVRHVYGEESDISA